MAKAETSTTDPPSHADTAGGEAPTWGDLTRSELQQLADSDYPAAPVAEALLTEKPEGI